MPRWDRHRSGAAVQGGEHAVLAASTVEQRHAGMLGATRQPLELGSPSSDQHQSERRVAHARQRIDERVDVLARVVMAQAPGPQHVRRGGDSRQPAQLQVAGAGDIGEQGSHAVGNDGDASTVETEHRDRVVGRALAGRDHRCAVADAMGQCAGECVERGAACASRRRSPRLDVVQRHHLA